MGGKAGVRTEYQPPAPVLALIQPFLDTNPDFFTKSKTRKGAMLPSDSPAHPAPPVARKGLVDSDETNKEGNMPIAENDISWSLKKAKEIALRDGLDLNGDQRLEFALYIHNQLFDKQLDKAGFLMGMLELVNKAIEINSSGK